jgi:hypothetical protein
MKILAQDTSLAGYQHIKSGWIESGDLIVGGPSRKKHLVEATDYSIGCDIGEFSFDVYRKMECPKHEGQMNAAYKHGLIADAVNIPAQEDHAPRAKTYDDGKPPMAHLPWKALREVSLVQIAGKDKYGDFHNYRKGMEVGRNLSCAVRHIADFMDGDDLDSETKRSHLASAALRCLFALQNILEKTAIDDRYNKNK